MKITTEYYDEVIVRIITKGETLLDNLGFNKCEVGIRNDKITYNRKQKGKWMDNEYIIFSLKDIYDEELGLTVYCGMGYEDSISIDEKLLEAIVLRFKEIKEGGLLWLNTLK